MTSQELSNMIFNIKDKITDKEFKDIMDKLSVKNEEEKQDTYELRYIKRDTRVGRITNKNIGWRMNDKIKIKKVKLADVCNCNINRIIEKQNGFFEDIDATRYNYYITKKDGDRYFGIKNGKEVEWLQNHDVRDEDGDVDDEDDCGIWFAFSDIFPIHIKKL